MKSHLVLLPLLMYADCFAAIVIPIELEKGNPIASAQINGVPVRLVIDSGGGVVALKPDTIERVAATRTGTTRSSTDAYGNNSTQALFMLNTLELGGNTFSNIEAGEAGKYVAETPGDGIIGRKFLNQFLAIYDYSSRKITLVKPRERASTDGKCRGTRVSTIPDSDGIIVSIAKTDHRAMRMLWDTGATYSFVKKTFADMHDLPVENPFYSSQRFMFGQHDFGPIQFVVLDASAPTNVDGYIGYNFFMTHVVCIDPRKRVVRIRKN
jgi:predicted aspartyl protease